MFSSFGEKTIKSTILYRIRMVTETKCHIILLSVGEHSADHCSTYTFGRRSAGHRAMVSRLENYVLDKVNW